jgi:ABC-type lipoprotein release transport system permease subunit
VHGQLYSAYGLGPSTLYRYQLSSGRWFTAADTATSPAVVVLGPAVARAAGARVGQRLAVLTPAGQTQVTVVGIALIGLVGTLTLALIERTREVGSCAASAPVPGRSAAYSTPRRW